MLNESKIIESISFVSIPLDQLIGMDTITKVSNLANINEYSTSIHGLDPEYLKSINDIELYMPTEYL